MRQRIARRVLASVFVALLAVTVMGCSRSTPEPPSGGAPYTEARSEGRQAEPMAGAGEASSRDHLTKLGIIGRPSGTEPRGLLITGFTGPSEDTPVAVIGVEEGDVIISCNGEQQQLGARLVAAIEGLQQRGEPITLVVVRKGEQVTLERTEKLPAAKTEAGP